MNKFLVLLVMLLLAAGLTGCGKKEEVPENTSVEQITSTEESGSAASIFAETGKNKEKQPGVLSVDDVRKLAEAKERGEDVEEAMARLASGESETSGETTSEGVETEVTEEETPTDAPTEEETKAEGKLIAIDAGHQAKANTAKEPIGPKASKLKMKVTGGTKGVVSGVPEYELALNISLKLEQELLKRGYRVLMIRRTNDVDISNSERAMMANEAKADAFLRIHANGSKDPKDKGAMTICQTKKNPYNGSLYPLSRALSEHVLNEMSEATGCRKLKIWETDSMSGVNWAKVPTTIIEMGYMTNPEEDTLLTTKEYQVQLVQGIADGVDKFFEGRE